MNTRQKNLREKTCSVCGKLFQPTNGKSLTCSKDCSYKRKRNYDKKYQKNHPEKAAEWSRESAKNNRKRVNKAARERYQRNKKVIKIRNDTNQLLRKLGIKKLGECMDCHQIGKLEIHHITYTLDDFILICKKCHMKRHKKTLYVH